MPVCKQLLQFSLYEPTRKKIRDRAHGQFVLDAILQPAGRGAIRDESVGMFPATEWARALEIPELSSFQVSTMLELPAHAKGPHAYSKCAARAIMNSGDALQNFNRVPGRRETLQRAGLRVPRKNLLRRRVDTRSANKSLTHDGEVSTG